ncbi:lamin tail domain-containing protein [Nostocoides sp. HKS02]|uniref:lamin tail domain-containing protein n=1 Tax=Nostocoides sp. HKS02 TaxID=1813880 RepID=UPI001E430004|nr:lamin tail domain-containing protein [Tetrasphaera sp. HKS02]
MSRLRRAAAVLCLMGLTVGVGAVAAPGSADATTPAVKISFVRYDSPGPDTGTNASLNSEYVVIKNTTTTARSLTGWTLRDRTGYTYRFPTFTLRAGATVAVRTGKGTATATNRYYNHSWYIWNNTGDTAYLRNSAGTLVHSCAWTSVGVGYRYC